MLQFPTGPANGLPRLTVEELGYLSIPSAAEGTHRAPEATADILELGKAATAALDLEMLRIWPDQPSRAAGAAEYQLALTAIEQGDQAASVQHLQQAIVMHAIHAEAALQDPAFEAIRTPVQDLVGRLSVLARMQAEASIAEAEATMESTRESDAMPGPAGSIGPVVTNASPGHNATMAPGLPSPAGATTPAPGFDAIQSHVWEPVNRLTPPPQPVSLVPEPARPPGSAHPMDLAQAYFDIARAHFELGTYAGYVVAAQAATLAHQIATYSSVARVSKHPAIPDGASERGLRPLGRALRRATRRLWERLPLLAILLGWFFAGVLFGLASLPFQQASTTGIRSMLFPIWALGLVGIVLIGFVRSIRRITTQHPRL